MEINHLKAFVTVWHAGSFAAAAETLNVAPSSISRSISALEESLGTRLFQRTTRAMQPTEASLSFLPRAEGLIEDWESARQSVQEENAAPRGLLRVACSTAFAEIVIAPVLAQFSRDFPDLQIELVISDDRANLVEERIDLAVRHGAMQDSALVARKLSSTQYRLVANPDLLDRIGPLDQPEDLPGHPIVTFSFGEFRESWAFEKADKTARIAITPTVTANNALAVRSAAIGGSGIAMLADWTIRDQLRSGELVQVLPRWSVVVGSGIGDLWLVYPSRRFVPQKTRVFADFLQRVFAQAT